MARKFLIVMMLTLAGLGALGCLVLEFPHYDHHHHHYDDDHHH